MHCYEPEDNETDMFKRYEQIFNLKKFKADQRLLDVCLDEEDEWTTNTTLLKRLDLKPSD
jgi:hypothetical protein